MRACPGVLDNEHRVRRPKVARARGETPPGGAPDARQRRESPFRNADVRETSRDNRGGVVDVGASLSCVCAPFLRVLKIRPVQKSMKSTCFARNSKSVSRPVDVRVVFMATLASVGNTGEAGRPRVPEWQACTCWFSPERAASGSSLCAVSGSAAVHRAEPQPAQHAIDEAAI